MSVPVCHFLVFTKNYKTNQKSSKVKNKIRKKMTENKIQDCLLMQLTESNQKVSAALIRHFGKKRYIALDDIIGFKSDEVT